MSYWCLCHSGALKVMLVRDAGASRFQEQCWGSLFYSCSWGGVPAPMGAQMCAQLSSDPFLLWFLHPS